MSNSSDPLGRRVESAVAGGTTTNVLLDGDNEIADYDANGNLLERDIPGDRIDEPVAMVSPAGATTCVHTDKMGSIIAMSGSTGALSEGPYTYDAYGNGAPATGIPFKFTGQRLDPETGLYYYRARYYSAALGRFLQTDPIGYKDDVDWYTYVGNDPTNKVDQKGLEASCQFTGGCEGNFDNLGQKAAAAVSTIAIIAQPEGPGEAVAEAVEGTAASSTAASEAASAASTSGNAADTAALSTRANEVHSTLDPIAQNQRTTAIVQTDKGNIVASGARDLSPAQRAALKPGETAARSPGAHA